MPEVSTFLQWCQSAILHGIMSHKTPIIILTVMKFLYLIPENLHWFCFKVALSCQHIWEQNIRVQFWGKEFHAECYTPMAATIKDIVFSDVMPCSLVQSYWSLKEHTTCTLMMKSVDSPTVAINFYHNIQCHAPTLTNIPICKLYCFKPG